jgi:hypothetical protein
MAERALQWAPSGNPFEAVPSEVTRFIAGDDGKTCGYGYGPGWSMVFGSACGDLQVEPGQWIVRHEDGSLTVEDDWAADSER